MFLGLESSIYCTQNMSLSPLKRKFIDKLLVHKCIILLSRNPAKNDLNKPYHACMKSMKAPRIARDLSFLSYEAFPTDNLSDEDENNDSSVGEASL